MSILHSDEFLTKIDFLLLCFGKRFHLTIKITPKVPPSHKALLVVHFGCFGMCSIKGMFQSFSGQDYKVLSAVNILATSASDFFKVST